MRGRVWQPQSGAEQSTLVTAAGLSIWYIKICHCYGLAQPHSRIHPQLRVRLEPVQIVNYANSTITSLAAKMLYMVMCVVSGYKVLPSPTYFFGTVDVLT